MESVNDRYASDEEMGVVLIDDKAQIKKISNGLSEAVQDYFDTLSLDEMRFYRENRLDIVEDVTERLL